MRSILSPAFTGSKMKMIQTIFGQIKLMILQMFPRLGKRLGFSMTKREFNTFFKKMINDTVKHRRKMKTFRPDVIQASFF